MKKLWMVASLMIFASSLYASWHSFPDLDKNLHSTSKTPTTKTEQSEIQQLYPQLGERLYQDDDNGILFANHPEIFGERLAMLDLKHGLLYVEFDDPDRRIYLNHHNQHPEWFTVYGGEFVGEYRSTIVSDKSKYLIDPYKDYSQEHTLVYHEDKRRLDPEHTGQLTKNDDCEDRQEMSEQRNARIVRLATQALGIPDQKDLPSNKIKRN